MKSAYNGYSIAQNYIGYLYENGYELEKSYEEAVKLYTRSAEQGNIESQISLSIMYEYGKNVEKSKEEAIKWYKLAGNQGDEVALFYLNEIIKNI